MERLTSRIDGKVCYSRCEFKDVLRKLADYEDAEEQGLLLRLPCKVGDVVYEIEEDRLSSTMKTIEFEGQEYHRHVPHYFINMDVFTLSKIDKVGKTVFLTKEEAEKALAERKNDE